MVQPEIPPSEEVQLETRVRQLDKITKQGVAMMIGSAVVLGVGIEIGGTVEDICIVVGSLGEFFGFGGAMIWTRQ